MGMVTLLFEASTPFLHVRLTLIQAKAAGGRLFSVVNLAFAAAFFAARIVFGLYKCWAPGQWFWQMEDLLASGRAHVPSIVRVFQVSCAVLSALNVFWAAQIVKGALGGGGKKKRAAGGDVVDKKGK
jgi:hypothetical protein